MGKSADEIPSSNFSFKTESDAVPVYPCQGWVNPCVFCDKRFGEWIDSTQENVAKIPTMTGIFQVAFMCENTTEVVSITLHTHDVQKVACEAVDHAQKCIANIESEVTETVILCRWATFKDSNDKDLPVFCAHWYNSGVLPKLLKLWPGLEILQKTDSLIFLEKCQKWCYPKKEVSWKKPKFFLRKSALVVKSCSFTGVCEICDAYFTEWQRLDSVIANDEAPDANGICLVAICCGQEIEVVEIVYGPDIIINIKQEVEDSYRYKMYWLNKYDCSSKKAFLLVRWVKLKDLVSDQSCFLYAHWLNTNDALFSRCFQSVMIGQEIIKRNRHFAFRTRDQKFFYQTGAFKQIQRNKFKQQRNTLNDLDSRMRYSPVAPDPRWVENRK